MLFVTVCPLFVRSSPAVTCVLFQSYCVHIVLFNPQFEKPQNVIEVRGSEKKKEHTCSQLSFAVALDKTPGANFACSKPKAHENNKFLRFPECY